MLIGIDYYSYDNEFGNLNKCINEETEIDLIKINYRLIDYISKEEGVSIKESPSSFILRNIRVSIEFRYCYIE